MSLLVCVTKDITPKVFKKQSLSPYHVQPVQEQLQQLQGDPNARLIREKGNDNIKFYRKIFLPMKRDLPEGE